MYKVIYWRFGIRYIDEYIELPDAHHKFNFIGEYDKGFSECILDENNIIIRDGFSNVIGLNKNRKGETYIFE